MPLCAAWFAVGGGSLREVEGAEERGVGAGVEGLLGGALGGVVE
jgi:hypothetical protein